jgi:hypothetical protein
MKYCKLFDLYKKLKYIQKLKLVNRFNDILCNVKKICSKSKEILFGFKGKSSISVSMNLKRIRYVQCYGMPKDGCFDPELLDKL